MFVMHSVLNGQSDYTQELGLIFFHCVLGRGIFVHNVGTAIIQLVVAYFSSIDVEKKSPEHFSSDMRKSGFSPKSFAPVQALSSQQVKWT